MHVFCTNLILWIRTLLKESIHELKELAEEEEEESPNKNAVNHHHEASLNNENCPTWQTMAQMASKLDEKCHPESTFLGDAIYHSSPYLYPFVIEFALIGAIISYIMWQHIGIK